MTRPVRAHCDPGLCRREPLPRQIQRQKRHHKSAEFVEKRSKEKDPRNLWKAPQRLHQCLRFFVHVASKQKNPADLTISRVEILVGYSLNSSC